MHTLHIWYRIVLLCLYVYTWAEELALQFWWCRVLKWNDDVLYNFNLRLYLYLYLLILYLYYVLFIMLCLATCIVSIIIASAKTRLRGTCLSVSYTRSRCSCFTVAHYLLRTLRRHVHICEYNLSFACCVYNHDGFNDLRKSNEKEEIHWYYGNNEYILWNSSIYLVNYKTLCIDKHIRKAQLLFLSFFIVICLPYKFYCKNYRNQKFNI